jgi:hypothetical protein
MSAEAKRDDLLYVSDSGRNLVYVFNYPNGKLVGTLTGFYFPQGECTDKKGDVFVTNSQGSSIDEYAHAGTKRIATLYESYATPDDCAVDRLSGRLAVANEHHGSYEAGDITIFAGTKKPPKEYAAIFGPIDCAYDASGNLYVDGYRSLGQSNYRFKFGSLLRGATRFGAINLHQYFEGAGGVGWDGTDVAVEDNYIGVIYRFAIAGGKATEVGTTTLEDSDHVYNFLIDGKYVIAPNYSGGTVGIYAYPAGGMPARIISGFEYPDGVAISRAN